MAPGSVMNDPSSGPMVEDGDPPRRRRAAADIGDAAQRALGKLTIGRVEASAMMTTTNSGSV